MAVFGEETIDVPLTFGVDPTGGPMSSKYCSTLKNMVLNQDNELTIRPDFLLIQQQGFTIRSIPVATTPTPRNLDQRDIEAFTATGSTTVDSPSVLTCFDNATTRSITWVNCNATLPTSVTQAITPARGVKAFCQYKDRYYGSNVTDTIFRISGFTTAATPLTITDLASIAGVNILLTFKNRIFGIFKNRIYYTDLPAIGGYPEVWNSSLNFIDLPTADLDATIYNAIIYKDKMYLFSDRGIYVLNANGAVTNWSVQLVSSDYLIIHKDSVAVNKGFIFFTNQIRVYAFNGVQFKDVTGSLYGAYRLYGFSGFPIVKLFAFDEGILLETLNYVNSAGNYILSLINYWYFDLKMWVEIVHGNGQTTIVKAGINLLPYRGKLPSSYICDSGVNWLYYDKNKYYGDAFNFTHSLSSGRSSKAYIINFPAIFAENRKYIRVKKWSIYGYYNSTDKTDAVGSIFAQTAVPLTSYQRYVQNVIMPARAIVGGQGLNSVYANNTNSQLYMYGWSTVDIDLPGVPTTVFNKIEAIYNSDNKDHELISNL